MLVISGLETLQRKATRRRATGRRSKCGRAAHGDRSEAARCTIAVRSTILKDDGPYRGTVDRLGPKVGQFTLGLAPRNGQATPAIAMAGLGATASGFLAAVSPMAMLVGLAASLTGAVIYERRLLLRSGPIVAVHARGLRTATDELVWDDLIELRLTGAGPWTVAFIGRDRARLVVRLAPAALIDAIDAIVAPGQRHRLEAMLDRGAAIPCGNYTLDQHGLSAVGTRLPWAELGPARRQRDQLVFDSSIGAFAIPLGALSNPGALAALINARGRSAPTPAAAR